VAILVWTSLWALAAIASLHRTRAAMAELREARDLSFFGLGGVTRQAIDFQWLLRAPGAERRFSHLVNGGSPSARVFGACGLYLVESDGFAAARERLSTDDSELEVGGCIRFTKRVRDLAADLPTFCPHLKMGVPRWAIAEVGRIAGR
jgi:hypothetical protein